MKTKTPYDYENQSPIRILMDCSELDNQELVTLYKHAERVLLEEKKAPWTVAYCGAEAYMRAVQKAYAERKLPKAWVEDVPSPWTEDGAL